MRKWMESQDTRPALHMAIDQLKPPLIIFSTVDQYWDVRASLALDGWQVMILLLVLLVSSVDAQ